MKRSLAPCLFGLALSLYISCTAAADTLQVPGDYPTIQAAINAAQNGDEVVVAPGTYPETINFLGKAITVRSSDGAGVTTIDAQGNGSVVTCNSGEGPDTILDGFTITGGTGTVILPSGLTVGGGMLNQNSSPAVSNCTFTGNSVTAFGGGMYNLNSNTTVTSCTFIGNFAVNAGVPVGGGGMHNNSSNPTVINCTFINNTAIQGGAMTSGGDSRVVVTNCTFFANTSPYIGGAMYFDGGSGTVTSCTFSGNDAGHVAGAIYLRMGANLMVTSCTFTNNTAVLDGGGIYNNMSPLTVGDSLFCENTPDHIFGPYDDDGGNVFADTDICSEPGEDDPPSDPVYYSCEPAGEDNLVVVVHGWNTDFKKDYEGFWVPLAEEIGAAINAEGEWRVCAYDWTEDSLTPIPDIALNYALAHGTALGWEIAAQRYNHVHLVGHSAGSALIGAAAFWISLLSPETIVHTTFLDAYAGALNGPWAGGYVLLYGGFSHWSDHYFSREPLAGCPQCEPLCTWLFTQLRLPFAFNVDVSLVDDDTPYSEECLSSHSWPYLFYERSIDPPEYDIYGFPLSFDFQGKSWESVIEDYPVGDLHILDLPAAGGDDELVFQVRVDDPIDFTAVPYVTSGDKTVTVEQDGFTATTQSDPEPAAAWITLELDLPQPVNFVQFEAEFLSEPGAKGLLTVYFDGVELGFIDEEFAQPGASLYSLQSYADLGPGVHSLGFRLDPFADVASTVSVINVATGYGAFVPLGDLNVDGVVGVADLLILLANWGPCGDCNDCPADLDGDCNVGVADLLILLANWG